MLSLGTFSIVTNWNGPPWLLPPLKNIMHLLERCYKLQSSESDIENISDDCIAEFVNERNFDCCSDLFLEINNTRVKNIDWKNRKDIHLMKLITFVYCSIMDFPNNIFEIKTVVKKNFSTSSNDLLFSRFVTHHLHVTGEIVGYALELWDKKLRETQNLIPDFAHNLFSFDFFFVVKGIRLCVWRTKQLNIRGTNLTNVQYANIGLQVKFIDTMKYYQQSLSFLAKSAAQNEIANFRNSCQKFIEGNAIYPTAFNSFSDQDTRRVLVYLSSRKGVIPYELIKSHEDLDTTPEGVFFSRTKFYSLLKNEIISNEEYENIKTFWQILLLQKLSNLSNIHNLQDTIILCEIFENRAKKMTKRLPYNSGNVPRQACSVAASINTC